MARTAKTLTAAEIKAKKAELKTALKTVDSEHGKFVADHKAAVSAHAALVAGNQKALAALVKEHDKAVAASSKTVTALEAKLAKATAAAEKGRAKIASQLAALEPKAETAAA